MNIQLNITPKEVERLFEYHRFEVVRQTSIDYQHIHGSQFMEFAVEYVYIKNPIDGKLIPLMRAFDKLMQRLMRNVLYGVDKTEIIYSLMQ